MSDDVGRLVIDSWLAMFARQRRMAEDAASQLTEEQFYTRPAPTLNSVAAITNHMAGNLASRWTGFLTTDGEKPSRRREREFTDVPAVREAVMERWDRGWTALRSAVEALRPDDLRRTVTIRGEPFTVPGAVNRAIDHNAYRVGQIVAFARLLVGDDRWRWLTIPPGGSEAYNEAMARRFGPR